MSSSIFNTRWSEAMKIWQAVETVNWYFAEMVRQSDEHMLSSRDGVVKIRSLPRCLYWITCLRRFSIPCLLDINVSASFQYRLYWISCVHRFTVQWTVYNALNLQSFPNYPENLCNNGIKWKPRSNYKIAVNRRTHATQWKRWSEAMKIWHAVETVNWYFGN
jgi:hypothetical protein